MLARIANNHHGVAPGTSTETGITAVMVGVRVMTVEHGRGRDGTRSAWWCVPTPPPLHPVTA